MVPLLTRAFPAIPYPAFQPILLLLHRKYKKVKQKNIEKPHNFFSTVFHPRAAEDSLSSVKVWLQLALGQSWVYLWVQLHSDVPCQHHVLQKDSCDRDHSVPQVAHPQGLSKLNSGWTGDTAFSQFIVWVDKLTPSRKTRCRAVM